MAQWRTILWLRWRLTRNQWTRMGSANEAAGIVLAVLLGLAALLSCALGFYLGVRWLAGASSETLLLAWDGAALVFFFFWFVGVLTELQRAESLDLGRLLHLPVSLGQVFLLNYAASWITPSVLIALPGFVCMAVGLAVGRSDPAMLWLVPAVVGFFVWVTAVTYWLRGWLVSLMANERRRRTILVVASVAAVVLIQAPNFYFNVLRERAVAAGDVTLPAWFHAAHAWVPPLWVAAGAHELAAGRMLPAALVAAGGFLLGGVALGMSHRGTVRFYRDGERRRPAAGRVRSREPGRMLAWRLPGVPPEAAAVALGTLRSHLRAPEIKMALFGQIIMNAAFGFMFLRPGGAGFLQHFQSGTGTMIALLSLFGAVQIFFNQFGFDRDGFRLYVLMPVGRGNILLGKNLAAFPLIAMAGLLVLALALGFGLIGVAAFGAAVLTFCAGYLVFSTVGNWLSIVAPYRMASGSLKPTKVPPKVTLMIFVSMLLSPMISGVLCLPVVLELLNWYFQWGLPGPVSFLAAAALAAGAALAYFLLLGPLGRLLQQRERDILLAVTREIE